MKWSILFSAGAIVCGIIILYFGITEDDNESLICGGIVIGLQIASLLIKLLG